MKKLIVLLSSLMLCMNASAGQIQSNRKNQNSIVKATTNQAGLTFFEICSKQNTDQCKALGKRGYSQLEVQQVSDGFRSRSVKTGVALTATLVTLVPLAMMAGGTAGAVVVGVGAEAIFSIQGASVAGAAIWGGFLGGGTSGYFTVRELWNRFNPSNNWRIKNALNDISKQENLMVNLNIEDLARSLDESLLALDNLDGQDSVQDMTLN
jgi:hypothetical protein